MMNQNRFLRITFHIDIAALVCALRLNRFLVIMYMFLWPYVVNRQVSDTKYALSFSWILYYSRNARAKFLSLYNKFEFGKTKKYL